MVKVLYVNPLAVFLTAVFFVLDKGYEAICNTKAWDQVYAECQNVGRCANV